MAFVIRFSLIFVSLLFATSCTSTPEKVSCGQRDWYESGRHDGAQGATLDRLAKYKVECGHEFNSTWESVYTNGRNAGLVEYCASDNAYELGRMGIAYVYVCPSTVEAEFLAGYRRGQQARELEIANQKLDSEIDHLSNKLGRVDSKFEQREIASELEQLKKLRAKNEKNLDEVAK